MKDYLHSENNDDYINKDNDVIIAVTDFPEISFIENCHKRARGKHELTSRTEKEDLTDFSVAELLGEKMYLIKQALHFNKTLFFS